MVFRDKKEKVGFISPVGHWMRKNENFVYEKIEYLRDLHLIKSSREMFGLDWLHSGDYLKLRKMWNLVVLSQWLSIQDRI